MPRIPREAREGIMRAWLEILRQRHPEVSWVAIREEDQAEDETSPEQEIVCVR